MDTQKIRSQGNVIQQTRVTKDITGRYILSVRPFFRYCPYSVAHRASSCAITHLRASSRIITKHYSHKAEGWDKWRLNGASFFLPVDFKRSRKLLRRAHDNPSCLLMRCGAFVFQIESLRYWEDLVASVRASGSCLVRKD